MTARMYEVLPAGRDWPASVEALAQELASGVASIDVSAERRCQEAALGLLLRIDPAIWSAGFVAAQIYVPKWDKDLHGLPVAYKVSWGRVAYACPRDWVTPAVRAVLAIAAMLGGAVIEEAISKATFSALADSPLADAVLDALAHAMGVTR